MTNRPHAQKEGSPEDEALIFLRANRDTHTRWAEYFEQNPKAEAEYLATGVWEGAADQRRLERQYNAAIATFERLATSTRPTPDGEIGELVERLRRKQTLHLGPPRGRVEASLLNPDGPKAADRLEAQAADIARLREAASESRIALDAMMNSWFDYHDAHSLTQPVTGAAGNAFDLALAARDRIAELLDDTAALATRTDVR